VSAGAKDRRARDSLAVVTGGVAPWHCAGAEAGLASGICMTRIPEDSRNLRRSKWWRETLNVKEA